MDRISERVENALGKHDDMQSRLEQIDQVISHSTEEGTSEEEKPAQGDCPIWKCYCAKGNEKPIRCTRYRRGDKLY